MNLWLVFPVRQRVLNSFCVYRSMTRDEEAYPDPESFKPERFIKNGALNKDIRDPRNIIFGFGRRCISSKFHSIYHLKLILLFL
jgi:cytochrome P450